MLRIFICDDDALFLTRMKAQVDRFLTEAGLKARIHTFSSMEEISDQLLQSCDIALLDVDFAGKGYSGLDIARRLRQFRGDSVIIFVTNYIEYAPEGYEVQAFRYILKADVEQKLDGYLQQALQKFEQARETMKIQIEGELIDIPLQDILYVESQRHTLNLHARKGSGIRTYSFYGSMSDMEEKLTAQGFLRVHKSYLVNMRCIKRYRCREVELTGGEILRASEERYARQKQVYLLWKGGAVNG